MLAVELMKVIFEVEMTYNHFHEVLITHPAEMEKRCSLTIKAPETPWWKCGFVSSNFY